MKRNFILPISSLLLFFLCVYFGLKVAAIKPLWNDEYYTQVATIADRSYLEILVGKPGGAESNICPLFYMIQKAICDVTQYQTPPAWFEGHWTDDGTSRLPLRLNPVIFMSLACVFLFYYFARAHGFIWGFFSILVFFSSNITWAYAAEARPYALWFFLSTIQSILFITLCQEKTQEPSKIKRVWISLSIVHLLLSLTVIISLAQIISASILLWLFKERRLKSFISMTLIPASLCLYYYGNAPVHQYMFAYSPWTLIRSCVPQEHMMVILIYGILGGIYMMQKKVKKIKIFDDQETLSGGAYLGLTLLLFGAAWAIMAMFFFRNMSGEQGQQVAMRYFIFLTPVSTIASLYFLTNLIQVFQKNWWLKINCLIGLGGLLTISFIKSCLSFIRYSYNWF